MADPKKSATEESDAEKSENEKPTAAKPAAATKAKVAEKLSTLKRVKMHTSTAGFQQVPDLEDKGQPKYSPKTGKQLMKNGAEFVWNPGQEYDIPTDQADRYIELGYASEVTAAKAA